MTDRKIWKAVLCFAMSIVLAVPGCAANTPASESAQSDLQEAAQGGTGQEAAGQEAAGQDSALQENTEQAAAGEEISEQKETSGDVFDFEEGDQSTPAAAGEMPSKFDLRDVEVKGSGIVPPVRFQNPFGTCWSFGAIAAAEISILGSGLAQNDGYTEQTFNLSEKHLAYFTYKALDDPEDPQNGEGHKFGAPVPSSERMSGGETSYATSLFASGIGPNLEDRRGLDTGDGDILVYKGRNGETESKFVTWYDENGEKHSGMRRVCYSQDDDWSIPEKYRFYQSYRLKDSYILPSPSQLQFEFGKEAEAIYTYNPRGTEAIKQQLLANRGVSIGLNAESSRPDWTTKKWKYLSPKWAQYTYEAAFGSAHAVCIVGWDDDYPKENFIEGHQPPENGAWLVRNSWGSDYNDFPNNSYRHWGIEQEENKHNGYYWVSYYDWTLEDPEAFVFDKSNVGSSYYVEQYDYMPAEKIKEVESDTEMKTANVFVADQNAKLTEISTVTTTPNSEVSYEIYLLRSRYRNPSDGVLIQSGEGFKFEYGGYHRFALKEPVLLFRKQAYSVVISQKTPSGKSVFNIVCGDRHKELSELFPESFQEEVPVGSTEEFAAEEAPAGNTETAAVEEPEGNTGAAVPEENPEEVHEEEELFDDELVERWTDFIVNRRESYLWTDGKWIDLTSKTASDMILGTGKKNYSDPDAYDNLPIKAYLEDAEQAAYPDPAADIELASAPGKNTKQVNFKLMGRVEEWDTNPVFTWTSSDTGIFTVEPLDSEEGVMQIIGISPGRAYLTISSEEMGTRVVGVTVE